MLHSRELPMLQVMWRMPCHWCEHAKTLRDGFAGHIAIQLQLANQCPARNSEDIGGFLLVPTGLRQDLENGVLLQTIQRISPYLLRLNFPHLLTSNFGRNIT